MVLFIMASTVVLKTDQQSNTGTSLVIVVLIQLATIVPVASAAVAILVVLSRGLKVSGSGSEAQEAAGKLEPMQDASPQEPVRSCDDGKLSHAALATKDAAPDDEP